MKKILSVFFVLILVFFAAGCNGIKTDCLNDLDNEINRLNKLTGLLEKINDLEAMLDELQKNKADLTKIKELEEEIWALRSVLQKVDIRTRLFPEWDSFRAGFLIKDLNYFLENEYEMFVNNFHNHILSISGQCIGSETDSDGYEIATFESNKSQISIKTRYQNGESLSVLGKWIQIDFLYTLENGFTLGTFDYCYWQFPQHYFSFVGIEKPNDAHYGTIKQIIEKTERQIYLEIKNERFGEYFIAENELKKYFNAVDYNSENKKITITLENNIITQEMFIKIMDTFFPLYADSPLIIKA